MNTKKKTIKSVLGCTLMGSVLIVSGFGLACYSAPNYTVRAVGVDSIPVNFANPNFSNNPSSSQPFSSSDYEAYNQGVLVSSSSSNSANITAGIISLKNGKYADRFKSAYRSSLDEYALLIDSTNATGSHTVNYEYRTKTALKLDANSKYMFTVNVFTETDASIADLYLYDKDGNVFSSIEGINSHNDWTPYTFFVSTNSLNNVELKLGMNLSGKGAVLFDNLSGFKLTDDQYSIEKGLAGNNYVETNKVDNVEKTLSFNQNGQLVYITEEDTDPVQINLNHVEYEFNKNSVKETVLDSDGTNDYAMKITNTDKTYSQFETEDDILTFAPNRVYKVDVKVKTKKLSGKATLELIRTDIEEDDEKYDATNHNKTISITSNTYSATSNSVTNDYSTYSFLINSHNSIPVSYKLKMGLGTSDSLTSGEMYVSEILVSKIDYSTFSSASTGSGIEKINFVDAYKSSNIMLDNGDFNAFEIEDYNSPMPAKVTDWTVTTGTNTQKYGVVNTKTFDSDLSSLNLSNLKNPSPSENNNILMMYNETADTLSYTSTSKSLSAKTYHKFEIDVNTQNANATIALVTKKGTSEITLCSKEINTSSSWETVSLYIHTGYQPADVYLKVSLNTTSYGYAYLDNAKFDYMLTATELEEEFKLAGNTTFTAVADMSKILDSSSNEKFATAYYFTGSNSDLKTTGTVTLNSSYLDEVVEGEDNRATFNAIAGSEDKKALAIWSIDDVNYTYTSNIGFHLTTGEDKYYKISVKMFTQGIGTNNSETDLNKIGASFKLTGFENSYTSIKSENEWTTFTYYIHPTSETTTYLELSLGNSEALTKGAVFFTDIEFVDNVSKDEYDKVVEGDYVKLAKAETTIDDDDKTEDSTPAEENKKGSNINWIYLIPGILTALAIIICAVGVAVRKIKWKKPVKKSKNAYDRSKTVSVQYYTRKATAMREEKVRELTKDLEKINAERKQYEDSYKQDLTKLRELKIKRANPSEITKLEKQIKKDQKLSANLGVTANRISEDLKYAQTDSYLNSLVRKLSREQANQKAENQEDAENK